MMKENRNFGDLFPPDTLRKLFPEDRSDQFFEALYGDVEEGAYDISLAYLQPDVWSARSLFPPSNHQC